MRGAEVRDRLSGETLSVEARAVVNATGPWIDSVRALEDPAAAPLGRLSQGRAPAAGARPSLVGGADDSPRPGACHVRVPMAGDAAARDDRHALRGRPVGGRRRAGGRRARPRRGVGGSRARGARPRSRPGQLRRAARSPRPERRDADGAARDPVRPRSRRHADGCGREADHLPPDRALGARAAAARARRGAVRPAGRRRCRAPAGSRMQAAGSRAAFPSSIPRPARTSCTCTAASRRRCSRPRCSNRRSSSRSIRTRPTCSRRSATQASRSGRSAWRTSSGGGRHSAIAAWRTPPPPAWRRTRLPGGSGLVLRPTRQSSSAISAAALAAPSVSTGR